MPRPSVDFDAIIAGGGIAGCAAAAALREFGWRVLVVEPGQRAERRLAGELLHPAGVAGLFELGLGDVTRIGAATIAGFAVFAEDIPDRAIRLRYGRSAAASDSAMAMEHGTLRAATLSAIKQQCHVEVMTDARVAAIDLDDDARATVTIRSAGCQTSLRCRMLVGADGASSLVRKAAGIGATQRRTSTASGYVVPADVLADPGFGHVFLGGSAPVLAYDIGHGNARVLFDHPAGQDGVPAASHRSRLIDALPHRLRAATKDAVLSQRGLTFVNTDVAVQQIVRGPVVLMGDAGGSCHPLTATGMTASIKDALLLRDALRESAGDIQAGSRIYARRRRAPQRTRMLLARMLHETMTSSDPTLRAVRTGLLRYWREAPSAGETSMNLLAMTDTRTRCLIREIIRVMLYGLLPSSSTASGTSRGGTLESVRLGWTLPALLTRHVYGAMRFR